jgi:hypothetical protein
MSKTTVAIIVAIIGAVGAIITGYLGKESGKDEGAKMIRYTVQVLDLADNSGIEAANVSLTVGALALAESTDLAGKRTFELGDKLANSLATVRASKSGYGQHEIQNPLPPRDGTITLRLEKSEHVATVPPDSKAAPSKVPRISEALPPVQSGPKLSGAMKNFSDWYQLCSPSLPPNVHIESERFSLAGDRSCGLWAECRRVKNDGSQVCYEFRLQGHDEWRPPGQASSEGILQITISKPGP